MKQVGIVGCGSIAKVHALSLKNMEDVELRGFADCIWERAAAYAKDYGDYGAGVYECVEEMIEQENLDAVHICTPHYLHVPMAVKLLGQHISVFMEKPPAITREGFLMLEEAEQKSRGTLGICFQNRYNESTRKVDELLAGGSMGAILGARAFVTWSRKEEYYKESRWRGKWKTEGGGVLINQSIHTLDLLVRWMGRADSVKASMVNFHLEDIIQVEDTVIAWIRLMGKPVCFYATTAYVVDSPVFIELECENGRIRLEENRVWCQYFSGYDMNYLLKRQEAPGKVYWGDGHDACIRDFYQCLREKRIYRNNLASTKDTFEVMMDIYDAAGMKLYDMEG